MFGSEMLEVAIGLVFVFMLVSIICSAVREGIEARVKSRAAYLEHGLRELLHDRQGTGLAKAVYEHPLVAGLYPGRYAPGDTGERPRTFARGGSLPSYIPARNFALAVLDIAARGLRTDAVSAHPDAPRLTAETVRANVANLGDPYVQRVVLTALDAAHDDLERATLAVQQWFDSAMDRVSGWYKRTTHWIVLWTAIVVAVVLNVNTLRIAHYLYDNDAARAAIVARAERAARDSATLGLEYVAARAALDSISLPIGWEGGACAPRACSELRAGDPFGRQLWNRALGPLIGWLLTALAATLGAPFWFDLLNKIMVIRSTVKPREKSPEEGSEDRRADRRRATPADGTARPGALSPPYAYPAPARHGAPAAAPAPNVRDEHSDRDGCEIDFAAAPATSDEDLPQATGGIASHA